jgi:hypothetical protein
MTNWGIHKFGNLLSEYQWFDAGLIEFEHILARVIL